MAKLLLTDQDGHELGRREMAPEERYDLYARCREHELLSYEGKRYTIHSVAWRVPEETCVVAVSFTSYEPSDDC